MLSLVYMLMLLHWRVFLEKLGNINILHPTIVHLNESRPLRLNWKSRSDDHVVGGQDKYPNLWNNLAVNKC